MPALREQLISGSFCRSCHRFQIKSLIQLFGSEEFLFEHNLADRLAGLERFLCYGSSFLITDQGIKNRNFSNTVLCIDSATLYVGGYSCTAFGGEDARGIRHYFDSLQEIVGDHRHHYV